MAKQNITFVERHAEKIVIGVTGAVLLGVLVVYGIGSPHRVELGGESKGPSEFYNDIKDAALSAARKMQNAHQQQVELPPFEIPDTAASLTAPDGTKPLRQFARVFTLPGRVVPGLDASVPTGKIQLARILAPTRPEVATGHAYAKIPDPEVVRLGERAGGGARGGLDVALTLTNDHTWVSLAALVNRKGQVDEFRKALYSPERLRFVVADVEVERQERLPSGGWGPSEPVRPYRPVTYANIKREVQLVERQGTWMPSEEDWQYLVACQQELASEQGQEDILRAKFQELLTSATDWTVPRELKGFGEVIDMSEYVALPEEKDEDGKPKASTTGRPSAAGPTKRDTKSGGTTSGSTDADARKKAKEDLENAEKAVEKKEYLEADELLQAVVSNQAALKTDLKKAEELQDRIKGDVERAQLAQQIKEQQKQRSAETYLGDEVEPLWLTDASVVPGQCYRYRIRLLAFNQYAGVAVELADRNDAGKVILPSEWSEWSAPIEAMPSKRLFFTGADSKEGTVQVCLYQWKNGKWSSESTGVRVGETVAFTKSGTEYSYEAVVADLEIGRTIRQRRQKGDTIRYDEKQSDVLTLVDARGAVEERICSEDRIRRRQLDNEIKEAEQPTREVKTPQRAVPNKPERLRTPSRGMDDFGPPGLRGGRARGSRDRERSSGGS